MVRVLHLVGSPTDDFHAELSRTYAADCLRETADASGLESAIAWVSPGGAWRFPTGLEQAEIEAAQPRSLRDALAVIEADVALPQMFCRAGMTEYRSLLDLLAMPFVGNPAEVMALTFDKPRTRAVVGAAGVRVPAGEVLGRGDRPTLDLPLVVKPAAADNSHGVSLVREPGELDEALEAARVHGDRVLAEAFVELGREVRCGVVERDGEPVCLPLEEYAVTADLRGTADKLVGGPDGALSLVAKDVTRAWIVDGEDPVVEAVHSAALRCHRALGCRDHSLFDFRIDPTGRPWFLEAGPYCSFAHGSVVCAMARAQGIEATQLLEEGIGMALARSREEVA